VGAAAADAELIPQRAAVYSDRLWYNKGERAPMIFWAFTALLVVGTANPSATPKPGDVGPRALLVASTETTRFAASTSVSFSLEIKNVGRKQVAIAKPMFPTGWTVKRRYWNGSQWEEKERSNGRGRGVPASGYPHRYSSTDYLALGPLEVFRITEDLNWYLSFPDSVLLPGSYEVIFVYRYMPTLDEGDIPLLTDKIESNVLAVEVTDE
jgi:hypothetical protein